MVMASIWRGWGAAVLALALGVRPAPAGAQAARPAGAAERMIIAGDRLRIGVAEQPDMDKVYTVAGDGTIDFGFLGRIVIAEQTVGQAAQMLERKLEESYFKDATVTVDVEEFVEGEIMVMGEVSRPGALPFKSDQIMTLLEVILKSGGLTREAAGNDVRILRWKPGGGMERQVISVDIQAMLENLDFSKDQYMRPRDIVFVPTLGASERKTSEFLALGDVNQPGFHPYTKGLDVIRAITRVGGISRDAKWESARLLRPTATGGFSIIPLDLARLFGSADMTINVEVQPGDILFVPSAAQASRGEAFLLGEVAQKGSVALPLDRNVTLAKTIMAAGGFTKFANENKVKILRTAPDGTKQTLVVDVGNILKTGNFEADVPLDSGDVIIVPEKVWGF